MMDLVSGAEVPAEEIVVTPAMIEAGAAKIFALACYIPGLFLTHEECREFAAEAYGR